MYPAFEGDEIPEDDRPFLRRVFESDVADHRWGLGVALGAPQALRFHGLYKRTPRLHYVLEGEYLPVPLGTMSAAMFGLDAGARFHFNDSGWYVGAGFGMWSLAIRGISFQGVSGLAAGLQAFYVSPGVGWLWHQTEGFTIGSEVGLHVPVYAWGEITPTAGTSTLATSLQQASREVLSHYGFLILPRVTLIRLSWILP